MVVTDPPEWFVDTGEQPPKKAITLKQEMVICLPKSSKTPLNFRKIDAYGGSMNSALLIVYRARRSTSLWAKVKLETILLAGRRLIPASAADALLKEGA